MNPDKRLDKTADLLKVLASPVRMRIVQLLSQHSDLSVSTIVNALKMGQSSTSNHLNKMSDYNMLVSRRQGKEIRYSLTDPALSEVVTQLMQQSPKPSQ